MCRFEKSLLLCSFCLLLLSCEITSEYSTRIPNVKIEILWPSGFKSSIPDEAGILSFTFNGKVNQKIGERENGTLSGKITKAVDGRWTYKDRLVLLRPGDVVYYWVKVNYIDENGQHELYKNDQSYRITGKNKNLFFLV